MSGHQMSHRPLAHRVGVAAALTALVLTTGATAAPSGDGSLRNSEWALTELNADRAWKISRGKGVTVAVIGTGVEASHPDLRGRITGGADFGDGATDGGTRDHGTKGEQGTHAAGIIAGTARNFRGDGLRGLAPEARVLPIGVYRDGKPDVAASAKALRHAASKGAEVINVSVSFTKPHAALRKAVDYAISKDAVVVAGAGDNGRDGNGATYPAAFPGVVSVSATDQKGTVWPGSHRGKTVVLAAPGVGILTTEREGDYWTGDGTAYAAPWVAASAALLRAEHPRWTSGQVIQKLIDTAARKGEAGRDARYGFGIVDPAKALADRAKPSAAASPLTDAAVDRPESTEDPAAAAAASSDAPGLLVIGVVTLALIVLAVLSVILVSRRRTPPPAD
ncbi:S8 family serine peptidase [Streptomyces gobiensis]|uniref:S8 family serine peptidase n=1 Tax=Streptomyces gobiensis TaxID=2875706 RepID=UPI001E2A91A4|nr:S8 family serine peptidase [Streptomyces gobiensis]UGY90952.1 S8 family serine peptidase [Streptomyces gobiensis]